MWIAGKISNIAKIRTRKSFVPHGKSVHLSTTSQLIDHIANSQSAILSVNESVNQQVSLSVNQSRSYQSVSKPVGQSAIKGPLNQTVNSLVNKSVH